MTFQLDSTQGPQWSRLRPRTIHQHSPGTPALPAHSSCLHIGSEYKPELVLSPLRGSSGQEECTSGCGPDPETYSWQESLNPSLLHSPDNLQGLQESGRPTSPPFSQCALPSPSGPGDAEQHTQVPYNFYSTKKSYKDASPTKGHRPLQGGNRQPGMEPPFVPTSLLCWSRTGDIRTGTWWVLALVCPALGGGGGK